MSPSGPSRGGGRAVLRRHLRFIGPGLVASVAYIDPGNWATDLQAGANYGYKLLFVVLVAGLAAVVLQTLAVRLGTTTSTSLPYQTRLLFLRLEAKYPRYKWALHTCLWFLYILAEIAIIGTDLAELIGSAVALNLLFPALPLWAGVIITAADVLLVLAFINSGKGRRGMMFFEIVIVCLVLAVFVSFAILLHLIKPQWKDVFFGLLPSATLVAPGATYTSIGIIGATVMPHALFLGSSLAGIDRLDMLPILPVAGKMAKDGGGKVVGRSIKSFLTRRKSKDHQTDGEGMTSEDVEMRVMPSLTGLGGPSNRVPVVQIGTFQESGSRASLETPQGLHAQTDKVDVILPEDHGGDGIDAEHARAMKEYEREMAAFDRIRWTKLHLEHATADTAFSLLGFALTINAAILTLAGAAFYYSTTGASADDATLQGAHALLRDYVGTGAALIFALALLCAGQSASITATLAGQVVSEGFINWRTSPFWRRLITRLIGVVPAAAVAASVGEAGLNTMLVASQVLLSIVLPTVIFPLVYLCSRQDIMTVSATVTPVSNTTEANNMSRSASTGPGMAQSQSPVATVDDTQKKSFKSPLWITILGYVLFAVVVLANVYVIVQLGLGNS